MFHKEKFLKIRVEIHNNMVQGYMDLWNDAVSNDSFVKIKKILNLKSNCGSPGWFAGWLGDRSAKEIIYFKLTFHCLYFF